MNLEHRIHLLSELGNYCLSEDAGWKETKHRAYLENGWFIPEFIEEAVQQIAREYLQKDKLAQWARQYGLPNEKETPKNVGLIMAGNIPLVGFHDFLSLFISGHRQLIKPSSRDEVLIRRLIGQLNHLDPEVSSYVSFAERLNGCDAYIATGSNNSARYFDYYFAQYPHIIRRNRSSIAILSGRETREELEGLAEDVYLYFGLGCRNVTKLYVPENYDFVPLLDAFRKYDYLADYAKYKHNYDYQLTILLLNKKYYMTNGTILLAENSAIFTPISVLNYEYYQPAAPPLPAPQPKAPAAGSPSQPSLLPTLAANPDVQCVVGEGGLPFGKAQHPALNDYADGVDTLQFLQDL
ncbi:MAG TPA: acyl-CoA reductase [Puia sp.]